METRLIHNQIDEMIERTPEGIWVIKGEIYMNKWVRESGRLDHDRVLIPLAQNHIIKGSIAIDVGAFIGDHTIAYLDSTGESGITVAYEPNPVAHECLRRNCPRSVNFQCAVGYKVGQTYMHIMDDNVGGSYLDDQGLLRVNCTTLDHDFSEILSPLGWHVVSLIKIDVEGCECEVLKGAEKIITQYRPVMLLEINNPAMQRRGHRNEWIRSFMADHRYRIELIPSDFNWTLPQFDILCLPS